MYVRLFRRRSDDAIYAQFCDGRVTNEIYRIPTLDPDDATGRVLALLRDRGRDPDHTRIITELAVAAH